MALSETRQKPLTPLFCPLIPKDKLYDGKNLLRGLTHSGCPVYIVKAINKVSYKVYKLPVSYPIDTCLVCNFNFIFN
jgi:hypothetical protein